MTADDFRALALSLPEAAEASHMDHPDFRVRGKIFATLGYPSMEWGVLKLTPQQQASFAAMGPDVFVPVKNSWGKRGATSVRLRAAHTSDVRKAMVAAWCNTAPRSLARTLDFPL